MPDIAHPTMPAAQVPSEGGAELATPQSDCFVGHCDATPGKRVFDIPEAEVEPMKELHSVTDDLGWEALALIQGFHRSVTPRTLT